MPDHNTTREVAREAALKKAADVAAKKGLAAPVLLHETGVADVRIVLEGGEIASIYVRNVEIAPAVSVTDLDYARDPVKEASRLSAKLLEQGYTLVPHMIEA